MHDYTVKADVDTMLRANDKAGIRSAIGVGTTDAPTFLAQTLTGQSLTGTQATSLVDMAATWNTTGTPTALKLNVTETASNFSSLLLDCQTGGTSRFRVTKNGAAVAQTVADNGGVFSAGSNGFKNIQFGGLTYNSNGMVAIRDPGLVVVRDLGGFCWENGTQNPATGTIELSLFKDAAGILAQRNGSSAQAFRVYDTYTDASNYRRLALIGSGAEMRILAQGAGASGAASLNLGSGTSPNWQITTGGNLVAYGDNTYDIGASGANRPRNVYVAQYVYSGQAGGFVVDGRAVITAPSDGVIKLADWPGSSFNRIQLGGTADTHPAIARDGAGIKITGAATGLTSWIKVPAVAVSALPLAATAGVGARSFVNDALTPVFGSAVTGGGAVAVPVYSTGSAWNVG